MIRPIRALTAVLATATAIALLAGPAAARRATPLSVSRTSAVAGQTLTFAGRLPGHGVRPLTVQRLSNGTWYAVGSGRTKPSGRFRVSAPKGAMPDDTYRVYAPATRLHGRRVTAVATKPRVITTINPEVALSVSHGAGTPGKAFTLTAAVTPAQAGRTVTFQRRDAAGDWQSVGSATTDATGHAHLTTSTSDPDDAVYQARAATYDQIAWRDSFPLALVPPTLAGLPAAADPASHVVYTDQRQPRTANDAGTTYDWGPIIEDWNWENGESLDPWQLWGDGSGRTTMDVGMIVLDSGPGTSYGDEVATLGTAGHSTGRWEWRTRVAESGRQRTPYTVRLELVPAGSPAETCTAEQITVADFTGYSSQTRLGATNGTGSWSATATGTPRNNEDWHTYAVEVTGSRITWLIDAHVVATLATPAAVSGRALVPRIELEGVPGVQMTHTRIGTDWVRYQSLATRGRTLPKGPTPAATVAPSAPTAPAAC